MNATVAPGHYPDMTNDAYQSGPGVSKSHLDDVAESPLHYFARRLDPNREPEVRTPALILGDAIHKAVLEPDLLKQNFAVWDGPPRNTKEGKAAWAEFLPTTLGKTVLSKDDYSTVIGVRDAAHRHPVARGLLVGGQPEQTYYSTDPETGELIKCRIDYDRLAYDGMMVDLKTTEDASPGGFGRSAANYRYHVQGGWYPHVVAQRGIVAENFIFIAIEKSPPYAIGVYYLEPEAAHLGMVEARRDLERIVECRKSGVWPDYGFEPQPLQLPEWKKRQLKNA